MPRPEHFHGRGGTSAEARDTMLAVYMIRGCSRQRSATRSIDRRGAGKCAGIPANPTDPLATQTAVLRLIALDSRSGHERDPSARRAHVGLHLSLEP